MAGVLPGILQIVYEVFQHLEAKSCIHMSGHMWFAAPQSLLSRCKMHADPFAVLHPKKNHGKKNLVRCTWLQCAPPETRACPSKAMLLLLARLRVPRSPEPQVKLPRCWPQPPLPDLGQFAMHQNMCAGTCLGTTGTNMCCYLSPRKWMLPLVRICPKRVLP